MMHQCGGGGSVGSIIDWPGGDGSVECKVVAFVLFFFFFFFDKRSLTLIENGHFFSQYNKCGCAELQAVDLVKEEDNVCNKEMFLLFLASFVIIILILLMGQKEKRE